MADSSSSDPRFTVQDSLELRALAAGRPRLLTGSASLERSIRWTHIIGQDRPGSMLQGGELVLSTLPRLDERRENLTELLRVYLADLDAVDAAALAVEVLPDRPRLLAALHTLTAQREGHDGASQAMPVLLFERVVRFVEITEAVHRELVSRQLGRFRSDALQQDPLLSATTNLLDDLAAPGGLPESETAARAMALGMPGESLPGRTSRAPAFTALVVRVEETPAGHETGTSVALASLIRETAAKMRIPVLVGTRAGAALSVLVANADPQRLCIAVRDEAARRRSRELVPRYIIAAGQLGGRDHVTLQESPRALNHAAEVSMSASLVLERSSVAPDATVSGSPRGSADSAGAVPESVRERGFWTAKDLGLKGLLVHLTSNPQSRSAVGWFLDHHLAALRGPNSLEMRELVHAMARSGGNKAGLARDLGISRPTLYARLDRIERALGTPLEGEALTLLQTALVLDELQG